MATSQEYRLTLECNYTKLTPKGITLGEITK